VKIVYKMYTGTERRSHELWIQPDLDYTSIIILPSTQKIALIVPVSRYWLYMLYIRSITHSQYYHEIEIYVQDYSKLIIIKRIILTNYYDYILLFQSIFVQKL